MSLSTSSWTQRVRRSLRGSHPQTRRHRGGERGPRYEDHRLTVHHGSTLSIVFLTVSQAVSFSTLCFAGVFLKDSKYRIPMHSQCVGAGDMQSEVIKKRGESQHTANFYCLFWLRKCFTAKNLMKWQHCSPEETCSKSKSTRVRWALFWTFWVFSYFRQWYRSMIPDTLRVVNPSMRGDLTECWSTCLITLRAGRIDNYGALRCIWSKCIVVVL